MNEPHQNHHEPVVVTHPPNGAAVPPILAPTDSSRTPIQFHQGTGFRAAIFVVLLAVALGGVYMYGRWTRSRAEYALATKTQEAMDEAPTVDVVSVVRSSPARLITLPGDARPFYETVLFARTSGYVQKWMVDIGDHVKEGQLLATIETPELDDQLKEAQAKVEELKAEVKLSQAAADFAKITFDRWDTGTPDGVVSQQERDQKKADLESSLAHVEASKADVTLGQADVARLQTLEGFKQVTAPFSGIITERHVDIGDLVTAGSTSSTTSLFKIAQYDQLRVFVDVPQATSGDIFVGMPVSAHAPDHPEHIYQGKVDRTAGAIDPNARTLKVEVLVSNPDLSLLPGTYLQVDFKTTRPTPPLRIPAGALTMRSSGPEAAVVAPDGTVTFHKLKIDRDLGDYVEVDGGLSEGEQVALNISHDVTDGEKVKTQTTETFGPVAGAMPSQTASLRAPHAAMSALR